MIVTQWDATNPRGIAHNAQAAAFYIDGLFANEAGVRADAPHAFLTGITVQGHSLARICDTEPGNIGIDGALRWLADQRKNDPLRIGADAYGLYADGSDWDRMGHTDGVRWIAAPDGNPAIPAGFHGKQYKWASLYDLSACATGYFPAPKPKPVDQHFYGRYPLGPFRVTASLTLWERATVQEYDTKLVHNVHGRYGPRIAVLRAHIRLLRDRIYSESLAHGWADDWRWWRWQKLDERLRGAVHLGVM